MGRPSAVVPKGYVNELRSIFQGSHINISGSSGSGNDSEVTVTTEEGGRGGTTESSGSGGKLRDGGKRVSAMPSVSVAERKRRIEEEAEHNNSNYIKNKTHASPP